MVKAVVEQKFDTNRVLIILKPVGRHGKFSAEFLGEVIVNASTRPLVEAVKVLSARGYPDNSLVAARHAGAEYDAMWGNLGAILRSSPQKEHDHDF
jgi:hypothetical protein